MPYESNADLPERVRFHLPAHAQDIWRAAFNAAWESHRDDPRREEIAPRIAWAAVKRRYLRVGRFWMPRTRQVLARIARDKGEKNAGA